MITSMSRKKEVEKMCKYILPEPTEEGFLATVDDLKAELVLPRC